MLDTKSAELQKNIATGMTIVKSKTTIARALRLAYSGFPSPIYEPTRPLAVKPIPRGII